MRVLVYPRDDSNPYQRLLYAELRRCGGRVSYLGRLTPSQTLNLLLLPLEVAFRPGVRGQIVHLHWVFHFVLPGAHRLPFLRRVTYAWFTLWLCVIRLRGMHLVWTAHNVLPHSQVFADDIAARRSLVRASELVIAHSHSTLDALEALGAVPSRSAVIPHGPLGPGTPIAVQRVPGTGEGVRQFLFFGRVREYKGIDELLEAFAVLPEDVPAHLTIAGECDEPRLRARLDDVFKSRSSRVSMRIGKVPDVEVPSLLNRADIVVIPYRRITTSGSATLALGYGRPLIVPDLPSLVELPDRAVVRYDGTVSGLASAVTRLAYAAAPTLAAMSRAARVHATGVTWDGIAESTMTELVALRDCVPPDPPVAPMTGTYRGMLNE